MFYTIYKITNLINNKIYIGCHKTNNLDDGYMGSGKILKRAQEKYGIENFQKEILEVFDNPETMFEMEAKLVNSEFVDSDDSYNLKEGGYGGFDYLNSTGLNMKNHNYSEISTKGKAARKQAIDELCEKFGVDNVSQIPEIREKLSKNRYVKHGKDTYKTFSGKTHSQEAKKKMSEAKKNLYNGENNPSFGTMWIHNLEEKLSKKIKKDEFSDWETKGWLKGRKMKFL